MKKEKILEFEFEILIKFSIKLRRRFLNFLFLTKKLYFKIKKNDFPKNIYLNFNLVKNLYDHIKILLNI